MFILSNIQSKILQATLSALLLYISAKVSIPFYPVNFTLQTMAIGLNALLFGARGSFYGTALYVCAGASGLPIFTSGGGISYMMGASGGYILGFLASSYIIKLKFSNLLTRYILGTTVVHALGALWLSHLGFNVSGIIISYMPGELMKLFFFASFIRLQHKH